MVAKKRRFGRWDRWPAGESKNRLRRENQRRPCKVTLAPEANIEEYNTAIAAA